MSSTTVRIGNATRERLGRIAEREGATMQDILEKAVESYRRQCFLEEVNAAYALLRADQREWDKLEQERTEWDGTLEDGLPKDEMWQENGRAVRRTISPARSRKSRLRRKGS